MRLENFYGNLFIKHGVKIVQKCNQIAVFDIFRVKIFSKTLYIDFLCTRRPLTLSGLSFHINIRPEGGGGAILPPKHLSYLTLLGLS